MTFIKLICRNIKLAVITTIWITTIFSSCDTSSDLLVTYNYWTEGLKEMAIVVVLSDYLPGIVVLMHHVSSEQWRKSNFSGHGLAVLKLALKLALHPFSLLVTHIMWLPKIFSHQSHRLARMSLLLHGGLEAPLQLIILMFGFSKAYLPLPWENSVPIVDQNDYQIFDALYLKLNDEN